MEPTVSRIVVTMAVFVLLGIPLVAFLWETLHQVLSLHAELWRVAAAVPALGLLGLLLFGAGRVYREVAEGAGTSGRRGAGE